MNSNDSQPQPGDPTPPTQIETLILPRTSEIAQGFKVRRALPSSRRRMVGPFIFLDQMGPEMLRAGKGLDIAPHPHIGLATVTYLFEGEAMHRDSLGVRQLIHPGDVNWMTAGRGIAHSERTPPEAHREGARMYGIQSWVALPLTHEENDPAFAHHGATELPVIEGEGKHVRLIAGSLFGERSPVQTAWEMFYADASLEQAARIPLMAGYEERAVYIVEGSIEVEQESGTFSDGQLIVFKPGSEITLRASGPSPARLMLLGGAAMDSPRHIWWNFVSSTRERIEQAKADWREGRFAQVPDETEFIPLPDDRPVVAKYP
jgi:redox-sensitive bicupin YhaK (pirin superfamily)